MEITETKYEFIIGEYTAHTYVGEYGIHIDWFKNDDFIKSDEVPDAIHDEHDIKINEVM